MRSSKISLSVWLLLFLITTSNFASAKDWTIQQKQVWKTIENCWDNLAKEKKGKFLSNFHPEFKGFVNWRALPLDKDNLGKWIAFMSKNSNISVYTIEPVEIIIHKDVAIVQYYCELGLEIPPDKQVRSTYRYTDVLKKEKRKWLVIAAHKEKIE